MSVTNEDDVDKERTMGRKEIIPYALYRAHGYISPHFAADTGFTQNDLDLLWEALEYMFEHDHSAARGEMSTCKLFVFEHSSALGNARSRQLFDTVRVEPGEADRPARSFDDYQDRITVDRDSVPDGVTLHERV